MRQVDVGRPVKDVDGVLIALKKTMPDAIVSVASDGKKTYVYLKDGTEEDPTGQVMDWRDKPELMAMSSPIPSIADGASKASVTVLYADAFLKKPQRGNFKVVVSSQKKLKLSTRKFSMKTGRMTFEVGPTITPGTDVIRLEEPRSRLLMAEVTVEFVAPPFESDDSKVRTSVPVKKKGIWSVFRRVVKRG